MKLTVNAVENGGTVTLESGNKKAELELQETRGFWFDSPIHGRIWVRSFEAKATPTKSSGHG